MGNEGLYELAYLMHSAMNPKQAETAVSPQEMDQLITRYLHVLSACASQDDLRKVTALDDFYLPVEVVKATYERLIALGCEDHDVLQKYASWLYLNGPDWDDEADRLMERLQHKPDVTSQG